MKQLTHSRKYISLLTILLLTTTLFLTGCGKKNTSDTNLPLKVNSADDLPGKVIGVQLGTTGDIYVSDYENDDAGTVIDRYNKGNDAIQALKQDKADCVVIDEEPAKAFVAKNSELLILEEEFTIEDYAICVSKEHPELTTAINEAFAALSEDGTIANIKKNYTGTDEEKGQFPYKKKDVARPNGKLIVATNAAFPPYEYYSNGEITGLDMDLMQAVCDYLGKELVIEDMEFDSIITAVQSGKADCGASGMTITEERLKNIDFSDSYTTAKQVIIVKDPNAKVEKLSFTEKFKQNFIDNNNWQYLLKGLKNTLIISIFAAIIGIVLGFVIAIIRSWHDMHGGLYIINFICKLYLTIVRGTPVMVQILIIYYVVFASVSINKVLVAIIAFGLNSAAYVAEIVRGGIMSIDKGQFEAGRSLGLNFTQTMWNIVLPQAFKNVLPALANEFIVLIKETSISGYIGLADLTKGGDTIRSITYEAMLPLFAVAIIYLIIVLTLTKLVELLERRLSTDGK